MKEYYKLSDDELAALQHKNLEMAVYFTNFCRENGIRVFLCGGACLGAIRHHGFIPWDDDVDLFIPAPDFKKLEEIWDNKADTEHYSLCVESREYNDHHLTPTVRDNYTTFITEETCHTDTNQGVALEIGVLNACPDSRLAQKVQLVLAAGASLFKAQRLPNRQSKAIYHASKILLGLFRGKDIRYFLWSTMESLATRANKNYEQARYVREFTMFPYIKWLYHREWFDEMRWVPFENTQLPVPKGCEAYLTQRYGNYMELPPEKDRHPEHHLIYMNLNESYKKYRGIHYYTEGA